MKFVDLSAPIEPSPPGTPDFQRTEIVYLDHAAGAREIEQLFHVTPDLLRDGEGWSRETITLGTHNSTHVDAPYHYNSRNRGRLAETIDQLPLDRFFGPGVVVDMTWKLDGQAVTQAEMAAGIVDAGHDLKRGDIVLVRTGCDQFYGRDDYMEHGPGVTGDATRWLFERGVLVMGIDAWGWDRPLSMQADDAIASGAKGVFWEAHQVDLPYSQIERLVNLDRLPPSGFTVACFPLPILRASAAPARVVALLED